MITKYQRVRVIKCTNLIWTDLEYRILQALQSQQETFPEWKRRPDPVSYSALVFHISVGIQTLLGGRNHPVVLNLKDQHQLVLRLLGTPTKGYMHAIVKGYAECHIGLSR